MDVVLLRWPSEADRRDELAAQGRPRLLLVDGGEPPLAEDPLEDWIRVPAADADVSSRVEALRRRAVGRPGADRPELDNDGVLRHLGRWVSLPPVESRMMVALLARFGAVVSREQLAAAGWPEGAPGRNALDVHVLRLRRRIAEVGLVIKTVRSRGYLLEGDPAGSLQQQA